MWRFLLIAALLCGCSDSDGRQAGRGDEGTPTICVVNGPLQAMAKRIAGDGFEVLFPAPPDVDPAYWHPDADTIVQFQKADLILLNGAGYAKWVPRVSLPASRLVDTSSGFDDEFIALEDAVKHKHGPEGEHEHEGFAFTIWLDLGLAGRQVAAIRQALTRRWPELSKDFQEAASDLEKELDDLDKRLLATAQRLGRSPLVVSHPVYQYWTRRYGLNVRSVHWEPDAMPTEKMWLELAELRKTHPAQLMVWEGTPLPEIVERLEKQGMKSVVFAPGANPGADEDWLDLMKKNVERFEAATR
jgi:zinc transport system substrate-binding protein